MRTLACLPSKTPTGHKTIPRLPANAGTQVVKRRRSKDAPGSLAPLLVLCAGLAAVASPVSALAEAPPNAPAPTPDLAGSTAANASGEVVVVAERSAALLDKVGVSTTVLTLPDIQADQELVVSDILAREPGVTVARNGGVGQTTSLFIRGAESDQTLVMIDGVRLDDPSAPGGGFDFGNLLVGDISRIEVLRGPQSTLYGSQAIGGVVNIVTVDPTRPLQGGAEVEGGTYDTLYGKASLGGKDGAWTWQMAANYYNTGGIDAFDQRLGGERPDSYHNVGATTRLGYEFAPDVSVDLRGVYIQARSRFDGYDTPTGAFGDDDESGATRESIGYAGLNFGLFDDRLKNRLAAQYTLTQRDDYDPEQAPVTKTFDGRGINARAEYEGTYAIAQGWTGVFGAESTRESITTSSPAYDLPGAPPTKAYDTINSGYGQLQAEPVHGLNLTAGLRYDAHSTFGGHTVGQASAAWSPNDGQTILRTSWGEGFKAPSVYELFSIYGNTGLKPEQAHGWDAGVEQRFWNGRLDLQATYFSRTTTDLIEFAYCIATCGNGYGDYENVDRAEAQGVELTGSVRPLHGLDITANYTYLDDRNRSPGPDFNNLLLRRPANTANLTATYVWPVQVTTAVAVRYAGKSYDDDANTVLLKSYALVDLRASYPLGHGLEAYARIENLFNKAYETTYQYGSLRRGYYGGLRVSF
jgi:vitamin B12 transporter